MGTSDSDGPAPGAVQPATTTSTAFDDDGNLMPGVVDPNASPADQAAQLMSRLRQQGFSESEAFGMAAAYLQDIAAPTPPPLQAPSAESARWSPDELRERIADVEAQIAQELLAEQSRHDSLLGPTILALMWATRRGCDCQFSQCSTATSTPHSTPRRIPWD